MIPHGRPPSGLGVGGCGGGSLEGGRWSSDPARTMIRLSDQPSQAGTDHAGRRASDHGRQRWQCRGPRGCWALQNGGRWGCRFEFGWPATRQRPEVSDFVARFLHDAKMCDITHTLRASGPPCPWPADSGRPCCGHRGQGRAAIGRDAPGRP